MSQMSLEEYVGSISTRFAASLVEDAMGASKALTQTWDLEEYYDQFNLLFNKVTLHDEYTISIFIEGLKPEIKCYVKLFKPQSLREAYSLAILQDQAKSQWV